MVGEGVSIVDSVIIYDFIYVVECVIARGLVVGEQLFADREP